MQRVQLGPSGDLLRSACKPCLHTAVPADVPSHAINGQLFNVLLMSARTSLLLSQGLHAGLQGPDCPLKTYRNILEDLINTVGALPRIRALGIMHTPQQQTL